MKFVEYFSYWIQRAAILLVLFFIGCAAAPLEARVRINPDALSFANQSVGTTSTPLMITLTNSSRRDATIVSISSSLPQFSYSWPSLPYTMGTDQQLTGTATFKPAASQSYNGTLTFRFASGQSIVVSLTGTGVLAQSSGTQPSVTTQPASVSVVPGQTATFSVAATGTAPLSYKWMKNGTAITGATSSSYTTPATTTSDSGSKFTVMYQ